MWMDKGMNNMTIIINPDFNLFMWILLIIFTLRGSVNVVSGLLQIDILKREKCGTLEILCGITALILFIWVII